MNRDRDRDQVARDYDVTVTKNLGHAVLYHRCTPFGTWWDSSPENNKTFSKHKQIQIEYLQYRLDQKYDGQFRK
jgi:hypothetical protein